MSDSRDANYYRALLSHRSVSRRGLLRGLFGAGKKIQQQIDESVIKRSDGRPPKLSLKRYLCIYVAGVATVLPPVLMALFPTK